jgi:hypothetical protein
LSIVVTLRDSISNTARTSIHLLACACTVICKDVSVTIKILDISNCPILYITHIVLDSDSEEEREREKDTSSI